MIKAKEIILSGKIITSSCPNVPNTDFSVDKLVSKYWNNIRLPSGEKCAKDTRGIVVSEIR